MDNSNINFDKFIRNKISDVEFSAEKDSWELLNYMLKQRAKARQRKRFLKYFLSILVIVSGTWLFLTLDRKAENSTVGSNNGSKQENNVVDKSGSSQDLKTQTPVQLNFSEDAEGKNYNAGASKKKIIPLGSSVKRKSNRDVPVVNSYSIPIDNTESHRDETASQATYEDAAAEPNFTVEDFYSAMNEYTWDSDSFKIEITNAGKEVNSAYSDFAPVISADGSTMYFTSRRPVSAKEVMQRKPGMEHIYVSSLNSHKNKWINTFVLPGTINVEERNNSVIAFSPDGQRMLMYRDDMYGNGDIYESVMEETGWSEPVLMPHPVNTKYHESSACFSPDGKTLYFISDRPGGIGGRDIWYCKLNENGKWGNATNIGLPVNSPEDEEGIFVHPDGKTIYFGSKGHDGLGGYDIYRTVFRDGKWSTPVNLGSPLNTPDDDVYFVLEANGTTGYYASSGHGGNGEKDIYQVTFLWLRDKRITPR